MDSIAHKSKKEILVARRRVSLESSFILSQKSSSTMNEKLFAKNSGVVRTNG